MSVSRAERAAAAVLQLYDALPANGKPRNEEEFTVLAGIVAFFPNTHSPTNTTAHAHTDSDIDTHAASESERCEVVSLATGTKCIGADLADRDTPGMLLRDSHAEVLARRGLVRVLLQCMLAHRTGTHTEDCAHCILERVSVTASETDARDDNGENNNNNDNNNKDINNENHENNVENNENNKANNEENDRNGNKMINCSNAERESYFRMKSGVQLFLYVSDSPCGDASIYRSISGEQVFTGAKMRAPVPLCSLSSAASPSLSSAASSGVRERERYISQGKNEEENLPNQPQAIQEASKGKEENNTQENASDNPQRATQTNATAVHLSSQQREGEEILRESGAQILGAVRLKSGRSDLSSAHRTRSLSCSDKLCRWLALGAQGALALAGCESALCAPVALSGVVVGADPQGERESQCEALRRALCERLVSAGKDGLTDTHTQREGIELYLLENASPFVFRSAKAVAKARMQEKEEREVNTGNEDDEEANTETEAKGARKRAKISHSSSSKESHNDTHIDTQLDRERGRRHSPQSEKAQPCGNSINWQRYCRTTTDNAVRERKHTACGGSVEVTMAHTGLPQGSSLNKLQQQLLQQSQGERESFSPNNNSNNNISKNSDNNNNNNNNNVDDDKAKKKSNNKSKGPGKLLYSRLSSFALAQLVDSLNVAAAADNMHTGINTDIQSHGLETMRVSDANAHRFDYAQWKRRMRARVLSQQQQHQQCTENPLFAALAAAHEYRRREHDFFHAHEIFSQWKIEKRDDSMNASNVRK